MKIVKRTKRQVMAVSEYSSYYDADSKEVQDEFVLFKHLYKEKFCFLYIIIDKRSEYSTDSNYLFVAERPRKRTDDES